MKINLRTTFYVSVIILIFPLKVLSQQGNDKEGFKITPVSPNTASLGLYGQIPVGHYTGVPNIDIPLYEIDLDGKKIPISISYHGSGIRLAQEASSLGLGWTLNLGGCITKVVNGEDDFKSTNNAYKSYYFDAVSLTDMQNTVRNSDKTTSNVFSSYWEYINSAGKGEPDIYYYNFGGYSGKMMFDRVGTVYKGHTNTTTSAKAILLDPKNYIDVVYNPSNGNWTVKDMDGYIYGFETGESSFTYSLGVSGLLNKNEKQLKELSFNPAGFQTTAYYLTYIESPLKNRVTFNYESEYLYTPISVQEQMYNLTSPYVLQYYRFNTIPKTEVQLLRKYHDVTYSYNRIQQLRPTSVTFNGGTIQINALSRIDLQSVPNELVPKRISSVEIKDNSKKVVKSYSFTQSYRGSTPPGDLGYLYTRLMLDKVTENNGAEHSFVYNSEELPAKNSFETDFWGFYNMGQLEGSPKTFETVPTSGILGEILYGRDKRPKSYLLQNMMLTQILYPTGGTSDFYYEPHDIQQDVSYLFDKIHHGGGISTLIKGQDYNDPCNLYGITGKIVTQEFELTNGAEVAKLNFRVNNVSGGNNTCGSSVTNFSVSLEKFDGTNYVDWMGIQYDFSVAHNQLNYEKNNSQAFRYLGKGKYRLKLKVGIPGYVNFSVFAGLEYIDRSQVTEKILEGGGVRIQKIVNNIGDKSEVRRFSYSGVLSMYTPIFSTSQIVVPNYYNVSSLPGHSVIDFSTILSSEYSISSTSSIVPYSNAAQGNIVGYSKVKEHIGENSENGYTEYTFINGSNNRLGAGADIYIPFFPTGESAQNGSPLSITVFNEAGVSLKKDVFIYKINSIKNIPGFKIYVPKPLDALDGAFFGYYDIRVNESILDNKTSTSYVNGIVAQEVKEDYLYDPTYSLLTSVKMTGSQGKIKQQLIKYPFNYSDAVSIGMINKNLKGIPVEKISLVDNKVIAASRTEYKDTLSTYLPSKTYSFNSTVPQVLTAYFNFYKNDYTFTKYNSKGKLLEFLNPDKTFTSYLWDNLSLYPIAVIKNATYTQSLAAFNGFDFSGIGSVNSSKELVVRTNLPNSMVNTYTYKPLVGMTSKTDPRGVTEYYEYDIYQRLKAIIDQAKNVTTSMDYHYRSN